MTAMCSSPHLILTALLLLLPISQISVSFCVLWPKKQKPKKTNTTRKLSTWINLPSQAPFLSKKNFQKVWELITAFIQHNPSCCSCHGFPKKHPWPRNSGWETPWGRKVWSRGELRKRKWVNPELHRRVGKSLTSVCCGYRVFVNNTAAGTVEVCHQHPGLKWSIKLMQHKEPHKKRVNQTYLLQVMIHVVQVNKQTLNSGETCPQLSLLWHVYDGCGGCDRVRQVRLTADFKVNLFWLRELHFNSRLKCGSRGALVFFYVIALGQISCCQVTNCPKHLVVV